MRQQLSWVHFGDLHLQGKHDENYLDFLALIEEANDHLAGQIDFALLPGDNADDGTPEQYQLVRNGLQRLRLPTHILTGDHDRKGGTLDAFREFLEPQPYRALTMRGFRLLFLNAMDGTGKEEFDLGDEQFSWLQDELRCAREKRQRILLFLHLYPSELRTRGQELSRLIHDYDVELVEMGHTHYNELANDGHTIYAATRSTGQIEEGPPGFSITNVDGDVISWKFKERSLWPFVMIVSPADEKLIRSPRSPRQVVRGEIAIRARAFGGPRTQAQFWVDDLPKKEMQAREGVWQASWNSSEVADGSHTLVVEVSASGGPPARDEIHVLVNQSGRYPAPRRHPVDYENEIGAYATKGILGTQLGPNENGTKGPWPSWR